MECAWPWRGADGLGDRLGVACRVEQPTLEDDPHRPVVADDGDIGHPEPRELVDELFAEAKLASRTAHQQDHHRHVPLLFG
jgi:hypothetical protein